MRPHQSLPTPTQYPSTLQNRHHKPKPCHTSKQSRPSHYRPQLYTLLPSFLNILRIKFFPMCEIVHGMCRFDIYTVLVVRVRGCRSIHSLNAVDGVENVAYGEAGGGGDAFKIPHDGRWFVSIRWREMMMRLRIAKIKDPSVSSTRRH